MIKLQYANDEYILKLEDYELTPKSSELSRVLTSTYGVYGHLLDEGSPLNDKIHSLKNLNKDGTIKLLSELPGFEKEPPIPEGAIS